jgi:hypothetical protein
MDIKHKTDSSFSRFRVSSKFSLGGQVSRSEMPYVSYPRMLGLI